MNEIENYYLTIFTPTYNRGYILSNLFESLQRQTCKKFEWLIVDDGSTDNTKQEIESFKRKAEFEIRYYYEENAGKHVAINIGARLAKYEWFFIVDSDDTLTDDAISIAIKYCKQIYCDNRFGGVAGIRTYSNGTIIGSQVKQTVIDATAIEYRFKYKIKGDRAEIVRTRLLREYPFPVIENEKFFPESYIWYSMSRDNVLFRWFSEPIYITEYLDDGLTKNWHSTIARSPISTMISENVLVGMRNVPLTARIKNCINYYRHGIYAGIKISALLSDSEDKPLSIFCIPIALLIRFK